MNRSAVDQAVIRRPTCNLAVCMPKLTSALNYKILLYGIESFKSIQLTTSAALELTPSFPWFHQATSATAEETENLPVKP